MELLPERRRGGGESQAVYEHHTGWHGDVRVLRGSATFDCVIIELSLILIRGYCFV